MAKILTVRNYEQNQIGLNHHEMIQLVSFVCILMPQDMFSFLSGIERSNQQVGVWSRYGFWLVLNTETSSTHLLGIYIIIFVVGR